MPQTHDSELLFTHTLLSASNAKIVKKQILPDSPIVKPYRKTWQCESTYPLLHRTGGRRDPMMIGDEQPVEGFSEMGLRQFSTVSLITKYTKNTEGIPLSSNDISLYCTVGDQKCIFRVIWKKLDCHWTKFTDIWQNMNVMWALHSEGLPKRCIYHYHCYFWPGVPVVAEAANGSSPFFPQLPQRICRPTQRWGEKDSIAVVIRVLNNYPIIEWVTIYGGFPHSLFPLSGSAQSNPTRESESCPTIFSKLPPIFGLKLSQ